MGSKILRASRAVARFLGSRTAWYGVVGLCVLEALWFVFSAQYPMAFDENYHFGLIKLHAEQWLPFFTSQPHDAGVYGPIARDPSYLYHWLMSFPYRLVAGITSNQTAQVIVLRLMNVAMFAGALVLYRRIVRRLGVSRALSTGLFAIFVLVPVVPFLAAHINYDNLFLLAVPITILLSLRLLDAMKAKTIDIRTLVFLLATLFLSSLIKYPYLPVLAVTVVFLLWSAWRLGVVSRLGLRSLVASWGRLSALQKTLFAALLLVSFGLFAERYAVNILAYHDPVPACNAVISQDECMQYGPYGRDYLFAQTRPAAFHANILGYAWQWVYGMWYRLFFSINYDYATSPPLLVISVLAIVLAVLAAVGIALQFRQLFAGRSGRQLVLWMVLGYVLVLFVDGFSAYKKTGQPVAINGRYLIPFLPFMFAFGGLAWSRLLRAVPVTKAAAVSLVLAVFLLQGGGAMSFIVRSGDTWLWDNNTVRAANRVVRTVAWPFILGKDVY